MNSQTNRPRIAITGIGLVSSLGQSTQENWQNVLAGQSGIRTVTQCDISNIPAKIAGEIDTFSTEGIIPPKDLKKCDRFIQIGWVAAHEALTQAGLIEAETGKILEELQNRTGVILGSGIGGLTEIQKGCKTLSERGVGRLSPFFIPSILINMLGGQVSMAYGIKGANMAPVSACATGTHSIGDAMHLIHNGTHDVIVAGGSEACICELAIGGFAAARALSTSYNDTPEKASRPFDKGRDGFVMGEGAGVLILERWEHAVARKANIIAELAGFGQTGDAYHMTSPLEGGEGAQRAMEQALADASLTGTDVGYVNAHATSTPPGDIAECKAIKAVCGDAVPVSSTKSMTGHMLGATGAVEAAFAVLALRDQIAPPTINVENQDPACDLDVIPNQARKLNLNVSVSNTFGFGGTNACLVFKKA